jgi:hypothetical protein
MHTNRIARLLADDTSTTTLDRVAPPATDFRSYGSDRPLHLLDPTSPQGRAAADHVRAARLPLYTPFIDALLNETGLASGKLDPRLVRELDEAKRAEYPCLFPPDQPTWSEREGALGRPFEVLVNVVESAWRRVCQQIPGSPYASHWERLEELTAVSRALTQMSFERDLGPDAPATPRLFVRSGIGTAGIQSDAFLRLLPKLTVEQNGEVVPVTDVAPLDDIARQNVHIIKRLAAIRFEHVDATSRSLGDNSYDRLTPRHFRTSLTSDGTSVRLDFAQPLAVHATGSPRIDPATTRYGLYKCPALTPLGGTAGSKISRRRRVRSTGNPGSTSTPDPTTGAAPFDDLVSAMYSAAVHIAKENGLLGPAIKAPAPRTPKAPGMDL